MLNILQKQSKPVFLLLIVLFSAHIARSQPPLKTVSTTKEYEKEVESDPAMQMIELKSIIPGIKYDLRYATKNNFMQRRMYPRNTRKTFLRSPAAHALAEVQKELGKSGLGLKVFDAYRPYSVTVKFWELVHDERYVANPSKGSGHNRGIAVDLTILNLKTGEELDMGTGFDNFTDTAHHDYKKLPQKVLENRALLLSVMEKYGFKKYDSEWWHYYLPGGDKYSVLDLPFRSL